MKFLLDTDAISEPARRKPSPRFMASLGAHVGEIAISSVTVGEIVYGARRVPHGDRYLEYLRTAVIPYVPVLTFDVAVATRYGELRAQLESAGTPLPDLDLQIAATALVHNLELVTGNQRHFRRIEELELPDWFGERGK